MFDHWPKEGDEYEELVGKKRKGVVRRANAYWAILEFGGGTQTRVWNKHLNDPEKWKLTKDIEKESK